MDQAALKSALRKEMDARRRKLSPEAVAEASGHIFFRWRNRFSMRSIAYLHMFQSIELRREVDTAAFFEYIRIRHPRINVVVPMVDTYHDTLRHAHLSDDIEMVKNRWGIPEPKLPVRFVQPMMLDMVLVPLLAFDLQGHRLGYGKGHYDRFLSMTRPKCLRVGLAYDFQKVEAGIPTEPHDFPLDFVITEAGVYRTNENLTI